MLASESDELRDRRERLRGLRFLLRVSKDKGKYSKLQNVRQCLYFETADLGLTDGEVTYSKVGYDVLAEYAQKVTA